LYNIGALQSALGAEYRASNNDEGLKNAAKCYQVGVRVVVVKNDRSTLYVMFL